MAKKKRSKKRVSREIEEKDGRGSLFEQVKHETKQSIVIVFSFALFLIVTLSLAGRAGSAGAFIEHWLSVLFGRAELIVPLFFFLMGVSLFFYFRPAFFAPTLFGGVLFLTSVLGGVEVVFGERTAGYAGFIVAAPVLKLFDFWASFIVMATLFIISLLLMLNVSLVKSKVIEDGTNEEGKIPDAPDAPADDSISKFQALKNALGGLRKQKQEEYGEVPVFGVQENEDETKGASHEEKVEERGEEGKSVEGFTAPTFKTSARGRNADVAAPPFDLLENDKGKPSSGDIKANANIIKRTLKNFGIEVEMAEVNVGPSVTQYTMRPAEGVKLTRITGLHNDLALALAAHPIRIEAPIPGRSLVGLEIPNRVVALVGIRRLLSEEGFQASKFALSLALGRDVSGKAVYTALDKMPHLLIAGSTGSGKSVAIHGLMVSLLYKNSPDNLRFLLVDPKRVELSAYSGIPHLLAPVITDAKKTILALKWAVSEMERRYELLQGAKARDVHSYQATKESLENPMPYIVIVIDELADIMATYPRELEASIVRLAQMSRAVGIHLIVSTQRPSVEVITGLIKANITSRIAFQVASQVDSRTILDMAGAEKLLGNGDMLFLSGDTSKPRRIQGSFVNEREVRKVTQFLEDQYAGYDGGTVTIESDGEKDKKTIFDGVSMNDDEEDELYNEAKLIVLEAKKASASYLQRRLRIGYARAARLLDILEDRGVVGPGEGAKPREVYSDAVPEEQDIGDDPGPKEPGGSFFNTMQ
ncbi:MAG: DNA translocase FtsK [bacterium]|nr:DNA translocase FtsK [bacterium]